MARQQFNVPDLSNAVLGGAIWFAGLGVVGAFAAATGDPANVGASLGVMGFGIVGASVLLAALKSLKKTDEIQLTGCQSDTTRIKIQRRGASRAA